jgi:hypothetical protein
MVVLMNIVTIAINRYLVHMPVWCVCFGLDKIAFLVVFALQLLYLK